MKGNSCALVQGTIPASATAETLSQDSWSQGQDSNPRPFRYEAGVLPTQPYVQPTSYLSGGVH